MLQAPINDRKTQTTTSSKTAELLLEQEPFSLLLGYRDRSRQSSTFQQGKDLATLQKAYGNQATLRMQQGERERSHSISPLSTGISLLRHQYACEAGCPNCQEPPIQAKLNINRNQSESNSQPLFSTILPDDGDDVEYATQEASENMIDQDKNSRELSYGAGTGSYCAPQARFTNIPSGSLTTTLQNGIFGSPFHMDAQFAVNNPCSCKCGEYRQFIRGTIKRNGHPMIFNICSNVLDPTTFQEDCVRTNKGDEKYGYRSIPLRTSKFTSPDQVTGCVFNGFDWPGFRISKFNSGDVLEQDNEFEGQLVNTCESDKILTTSRWSLKGAITVP